jgi:DNA gyrase subunit A
MADETNTSILLPIDIEAEMRKSYLDYAMSVIIARALPDVRDGLKPVQRRILVAMNDLGLASNRGYRKCAKICGDTSGNYHPHGEAVIYPAMVRLAQDFNLRYMLVDGQGNFGSVDGDPGKRNRRLHSELRPDARRTRRPAVAHPESARQWRQRHRRRHGHEHPAAQSARDCGRRHSSH